MSIYSGIGLNQQEKNYYKVIYYMIFLLQLKVYKGFSKDNFSDEKFEDTFKKLYSKLCYNEIKICPNNMSNWMNNSKYIPPRFSFAVKDLASYYGVFVDIEMKGVGGLSSIPSFSDLSTTSKKTKKVNKIWLK